MLPIRIFSYRNSHHACYASRYGIILFWGYISCLLFSAFSFLKCSPVKFHVGDKAIRNSKDLAIICPIGRRPFHSSPFEPQTRVDWICSGGRHPLFTRASRREDSFGFIRRHSSTCSSVAIPRWRTYSRNRRSSLVPGSVILRIVYHI